MERDNILLAGILQNNNDLPHDAEASIHVVLEMDGVSNSYDLKEVQTIFFQCYADICIGNYVIPLKSYKANCSLSYDVYSKRTSWIGYDMEAFEKVKALGIEEDYAKVRLKLIPKEKYINRSDYLIKVSNHPNLLLPKNNFKTANDMFNVIVYDWMPLSLRRYLDKNPVSPMIFENKNIMKISRELLTAVKFLHDHEICKLTNIIFCHT